MPRSSSSVARNGWWCLLCLATVLLPIPVSAATRPLTIDIRAPRTLLHRSPSRLAIEDSRNLLKKAFPGASITLNKGDADIRILLPDLSTGKRAQVQPGRTKPYPTLPIPDASYGWTAIGRAGRTTLRLEASSPDGVASGLYGLLQEKLGIRFIHPRQTIFPNHRNWPLPPTFTFSGTPRFDKRGFHIHTLHPVELTEQLHDPTRPRAFEEVAEYLDWLARNGQNTFQFFLLRGVDRNAWPAHARRIVDYAHSRGILCGVEISLAMLQQQAFQAITLLRPVPSYRRQVDDTLAWLFQAKWDVITLEATMGEHLPVLGNLLPGVQGYLEEQVQKRYRAGLMYATHVICADEGEKVRRPSRPESGILIHTVMSYSVSEPKAPVYGNDNQRFMLEAAKGENRRRETWYWPESSYWVGFDSSVPLLLLTYLDARWDDIETMANIGVSGHLTFTSGWEWGYWLTDWSIARWSWLITDNGLTRETAPLSRLGELFPDPILTALWREALDLQKYYLKDRELQRYVSALTPFSELPHPLDRPFQPDPVFHYAWLLKKATPDQAAAVLRGPVADLDAYAAGMEQLASRLNHRIGVLEKGGSSTAELNALAVELANGLQVTSLRARHRALTLRALLARRDEQGIISKDRRESSRILARAGTVRSETLQLVRRQEASYRYPVELLAGRRQSLTAYFFGYLYPVSSLYFWEREEEQVRRGRFDPLFMNLWNMRRILGLESLFFR